MSVASRAFDFLHRDTVRAFGGETRVWVEGVRGSGEYDCGVAAAVGAVGASGDEISGVASMATDDVVVHVAAGDFSQEPRPDDVFLLGPAGTDGGPASSCRKYVITAVDRATDYQSHYRIRAMRH